MIFLVDTCSLLLAWPGETWPDSSHREKDPGSDMVIAQF